MSRPLHLPGFALAILLLLWPAIYNGQPFFCPDTTTYVRGADAAIEQATGWTTPWTLPAVAAQGADSSSAAATGAAAMPSVSSIAEKTVLAGRSIYYGALLYFGEITGGFWLSVAVQAGLLVTSVALTLGAMGLASAARTSLSLAIIGLLTPAALFASYLMPDVFTGLTILACAMLIAKPDLPRSHRVFWFVLLTAALSFHATHVLLAAALLVLGLGLQLRRPEPGRRVGLGAIAVALLLAVLAEKTFGLAVERFVGAPPLRPPFLMARVIDDGPGYDYLKASCPGNGFQVCRFMERLPTGSDDFLWSFDPARGVFATVDGQTRRALSAEQMRFVLAVIAHDPLGQASAAAGNVLYQLRLLRVPEFGYEAWNLDGYRVKIPEPHRSRLFDSPAGRSQMPVEPLGWVGMISFIAALGLIVWRLATRWRHVDPALRTLIGLLLVAVLLNAVICGVLSTPHHRYQARIAWLLPLAALMLEFWLRQPRPATAAPH